MEKYRPIATKLGFQSPKRYDVFLSFREPDVRKTLVDHLYQALSAAGLNVFLVGDQLEKSEIIGLTLEKAIESSAICIPIFSEGYADSAWCLREAAAMLRTPGSIIPLFYHVDPTDVRYPLKESSPYKQAFLRHYAHPDRYSGEEIDEWKDALGKISSNSGWYMDESLGDEFSLVRRVVIDVIRTLGTRQFEVAKHPVGLDSVKNAVIQKLYLNSGLTEVVVKVGIWGIGGIGKTTVAKAVYNQIYADFDAASFVFDVCTTARNLKDLTKLQKQILSDLSNYNEEVDSVDKGISLFKFHLRGKRVLLVLDEVNAVLQLDALVGDWLGPGSRVIITSRDRHILNVAGVSLECIVEVGGLEINEALELFSWHAFLQSSPSPSHEDLSKKIVEACKGHPLSLEVIGSFLYDRQDDTSCWTRALHDISFHPDIYQTLYSSYSSLSDEEKEIFVDIACFFIGEEKTCPIVFWKSLYKMVDTAVSNLLMKSLITIDNTGLFGMHDLLRDMGRTIAKTEKEGTRLWETAHLNTVSHIRFSRLQLKRGNPQRLAMLWRPGLHYLHLQNLLIEDMTEDTLDMLPSSLIWLRLEHCSFKIEMQEADKNPRHHRSMDNIMELKIMQLKGCYDLGISSLFPLSNLRLQHLDLERCESLYNLPDTIGFLSQLQHLYLGGCRNLNNLPDIIGNLLRLQHLYLGGCQNINNLPDTIGFLSQLQHLYLGGCRNLNNLPDTIGNLSQLQHLYLGGCQNINNLPDTIGNLSQLQHLYLGGCRNLNDLPNSIGNLSQLQHLNMFECLTLKNLPYTIGNLLQLEHLDLERCVSLNNLPDAIGNLSSLQHLDLRWCDKLNKLPETIGNLFQLQHLCLGSCKNLNNLPNTIGNLQQLQHLNLEGCINLKNLPDSTGNLSQLQHLNLEWCGSLKNIPDTFGNLSQLQQLKLRGCESLHNLPDSIDNLSQLEYFF
ncbi:hypothetical protein SUGI_1215090 [Cryptomeria japonica]|uniref:TIR domain-containing protein n=1 Tax=Cryptomeria japonica TaxID=3369 RepID=A0AAD3RPM3_CRYJA|nr:disease resistance protein RUN1 [Cryptomeria japonica]GLJ56288.1 hypothetical protein SUGI_1215090 [Cryptomeria japonica]